MEGPNCGKSSCAGKYRTPVVEISDRDKDPITPPRLLRSSSARNSFNLMEGGNFKNYGADQQRLQISEVHVDKFPTPQTFLCWEMRFQTEVCSCSNFPTEAMLWIKEVEVVNSVDDLKSLCFIQGRPFLHPPCRCEAPKPGRSSTEIPCIEESGKRREDPLPVLRDELAATVVQTAKLLLPVPAPLFQPMIMNYE